MSNVYDELLEEARQEVLEMRAKRDTLAESLDTLAAECRACEQQRDDLADALRELLALFEIANSPEHRRPTGTEIEQRKRAAWRHAREALAVLEEEQ